MYVLVVKDEKELNEIAKEKGLTLLHLDSSNELNSMFKAQEKSSIYDILISLGIKSNLSGFKYLKYILENNIDCSSSVTTHVYPTVAKEFNTTWSRVERGIRHSIERAVCNDVTYNLYLKIFGEFKGKPSNQQFLTGITEYLKEHKTIS